MLKAWFAVSSAVVEGRLDPKTVVLCLQAIASHDGTKFVSELDDVATCLEQCMCDIAALRERITALHAVLSPPTDKDILSRNVTELHFSVRTRKILIKLGIETVGDLVSKRSDELLDVKNVGIGTLDEIRCKLANVGQKLRDD